MQVLFMIKWIYDEENSDIDNLTTEVVVSTAQEPENYVVIDKPTNINNDSS